MEAGDRTGLAGVLACPDRVDAEGLGRAWYDQSFAFRLRGAGRAPADIGGHLRRSFLGALGRGASPAARDNAPCTWDPPCALDVFGREQLRGPRGDGLPKPYVIRAWPHGADLMVEMRVFGMANDWAMVAAEALVVGMREILPWPRLLRTSASVPEIASRKLGLTRLSLPPPPDRVTLAFLSPVDGTGRDVFAQPHRLISRMIRRVDAVSRWNGVALVDETGRELARHAAGLDYDISGLRAGRYASPNRHRQSRRDPTVNGRLTIHGDLAPLWPVLHVATRCHIGRHAVEGLGAFQIADTVASASEALPSGTGPAHSARSF